MYKIGHRDESNVQFYILSIEQLCVDGKHLFPHGKEENGTNISMYYL